MLKYDMAKTVTGVFIKSQFPDMLSGSLFTLFSFIR